MRIAVARVGPRRFIYLFFFLFLFSFSSVAIGFAAEHVGESSTPPSKESFDLILPFKDVTVGQGQEVTMDADIVNRRREPVEVSLALDGIPKGWDVNFNSRYPSYPIRSVMVAGSDQSPRKHKAGNLPRQSDGQRHREPDTVCRDH
jgi:hypothetical protein